jgi:molybdenum cofactor biosynthesis protein B
VKAAVITVSDRVSRGEAEDQSGAILEQLLRADNFQVERHLVADERAPIGGLIKQLAADDIALVVTTGGTGLAARDVTPEATAAVLDREISGIAEAIRSDARQKTPHAILSRGLAGTRDRTLIVNLPGSPGGARDGYLILRPALRHALELVRGLDTVHRQS